MKQLTKSEKLFCEEYLKTFNKAAAYRAAFPQATEEEIRSKPQRLFKRRDIKNYIKQLQENFDEPIPDAEQIIAGIAEIAFSAPMIKDRLAALKLLNQAIPLNDAAKEEIIKIDIID